MNKYANNSGMVGVTVGVTVFVGVSVLLGVIVGVAVLLGVTGMVRVTVGVTEMVGVTVGVVVFVGVIDLVGVGVTQSNSTVTPAKNCSLVDSRFNCKKYLEQEVTPVMMFSTLFSHIGSVFITINLYVAILKNKF